MNNHKCPEELAAAIERSRVLESLTPAQAAAFDDVIAEKNRQIERAYDGLNYQDRQITELRAQVAELEKAILNAYYEGHEDAHGRYSESSEWATDCAIDWRNSEARQAIDAARD